LINQFAALSREEMDVVINMAVHAKNSLVRRCGASPCQWVFGRQPRVPSSLLSEPEAVEAKSMVDNNDALLQVEMVRHEAMKAFADYEFNQALRRAMLRKGRPYRGPLEVGQKIAYYRHRTQLDGEGTVEGYRQGMIIGLDPGPSGSVWIRNNRGRVVQAAREQVRSVEGEELWSPSTEDIKALKDTEIDLSQKHPHAFDHRSLAPSARTDQDASAVLDATGQVQQQQGEVPPVLVAIPPAASEPGRKASQSLSEITLPASQAEASSHKQPETPVIYLPPTPALPAPGTPSLASVPALPPIPEEDEPNSVLKLENIQSQPTSTVTTIAIRQAERGALKSNLMHSANNLTSLHLVREEPSEMLNRILPHYMNRIECSHSRKAKPPVWTLCVQFCLCTANIVEHKVQQFQKSINAPDAAQQNSCQIRSLLTTGLMK